MEPLSTQKDNQQLAAESLPFARSYQLEALEMAIKRNTIVFLETGSGKTLIAIMLLRSYAYFLRKPSPFIAVFLVPKVVLVSQQAEAISMHTDLTVGKYWGDMGVDYWDAGTWDKEMAKHEVLVMTPQILLNGLRHSFFKLDMIKVLILDECHHACGKNPYACIMTEFYHRQLKSGVSDLPRIFGMTASPIKSKGTGIDHSYWKKIHQLETLLNSKVYTRVSESVLAEFIPFSTPKFKLYEQVDIPRALYDRLTTDLQMLKVKHQTSVKSLDISSTKAESITKKLSKIYATFVYCLDELGVWLASKAAEFLSVHESEPFAWGELDVFGEKVIKNFSSDAFQAFSSYLPQGSQGTVWSIGDDIKSNMDSGFVTSKIDCLIELLLDYRKYKDIRCIVFVERVITAIVLEALLNELLPKYICWKTKYVAGNNSRLQSQTRTTQNQIVADFREGLVNIIVATSILEEGLDVQSCNLVIRFDPSMTVCSFIQSRGRARMKNSDYVSMVKSGDSTTIARLQNYISSGDKMRKESLSHASVPCLPLSSACDEDFYRVESTGAIATFSSSVSLIYFYCSRLPSDGYFKPTPRCEIVEERQTCTLYMPKSCPLQSVSIQGNIKNMKQAACLEACKKLHKIGALTDNLVPDIVVEEADAQRFEKAPYNDKHPIYFPPELVNKFPESTDAVYHCYLIELKQTFDSDIPIHDIVLATRTELELEILKTSFQLKAEKGILTVNLKSLGPMQLTSDQVLLCKKFQVTILGALMEHSVGRLTEVVNGYQLVNNLEFDYLLLPSTNSLEKLIESVASLWFSHKNTNAHTSNCSNGNSCIVQTHNGPLCTCKIQNSLVYTPHNNQMYCISGFLEHLNGNSNLRLKDGGLLTYKEYYEKRHGIQLSFDHQSLLNGRHVFHVKNYIQSGIKQKEKEPTRVSVELPPELCSLIFSPISHSTLYSFTFVPSIMHRLQSLLIAVNLKRMLLDRCTCDVAIPVTKVLEAITTKKCQESFHLESLETLGDSFLKYAVSQQLFKMFQNHHEGLLSVRKDRMISNMALSRLGCDHNLPGFIRMELFDPKKWLIPGDNSSSCNLSSVQLSDTRNICVVGRQKIKSKIVADVVEALLGAFVSTGGESAGLLFLNWIGIEVDFVYVPNERNFHLHAEKLVNVHYIESLLNYSFRDPSLLVEALTHGSYMLPEIPRCYQRLEFLGDAVLDYLITVHLFSKYPRLSPGFLTDLRSASVNNDCYAQCAVKHNLHKHILHASQELHKQIILAVKSFAKFSDSTFGWESETSYPKVLGDIVESLAGAILVDSGYNKEVVFKSVRPLLEPLVTPETVRFHPVRELNELCQKMHFDKKKAVVSQNHRVSSITIEVNTNGKIFKHTSTASDRKTAKKLASKEVLKAVKQSIRIEELGVRHGEAEYLECVKV